MQPNGIQLVIASEAAGCGIVRDAALRAGTSSRAEGSSHRP